MAKILGYIIALIGLIGVALGSNLFSKFISISAIPYLSAIKPLYILIIGAVLIVLGVVLAMTGSKGSGKQAKEVPIYSGKNVVGFRKV